MWKLILFMKGINIFLADGFEDIEALATGDVLRRGGMDVRLVSIYDELTVESSHGVSVIADFTLDEVDLSPDGTDAADVMIFPGGMPGTRNLAACEPLMDAMPPAALLRPFAPLRGWCSANLIRCRALNSLASRASRLLL